MNSDKINIDDEIEDLLKALRESKFSVGIDSHFDAIALRKKFCQNPENDLSKFKSYLSSLICKSETDKADFSRIYDNFELKIKENYQKIETETQKRQKEKRTKKLLIISFSIIFLISSLAFLRYWKKLHQPPKLNLEKLQPNKNYFFKEGDNTQNFAAFFLEQEKYNDFDIWFSSDSIENNFRKESITFDRIGRHILKLRIQSKPSAWFTYDTILVFKNIFVAPRIKTEIYTESTQNSINESVTYKIRPDVRIKLPFKWYVNDSTNSKWDNQKQINFVYTEAGTNFIQLKYDQSKDSLLSRFNDSFFVVDFEHVINDLNKVSLRYQEEIIPPIFHLKTNVFWVIFLSLIGLIGLIQAIIFLKDGIKPKITRVEIDEPTKFNESSADKPPFDFPFKSKEFLIQQTRPFETLIDAFRKTTKSPIENIDFSKTIKETIKNFDLISPVRSRRNVSQDSLFLIDWDYSNSQQFQLFSYLVKHFVRNSGNIFFYYFHQTPNQFFQKETDIGKPLSDLEFEFPNANLFIISNGKCFIDFNKPIINPIYRSKLDPFQNRILISPIPYQDWSHTEKILSNFFHLIPADIVGLLKIIKILDENYIEKPLFLQPELATYQSKLIEFHEIDALKNYLNHDHLLIQWVCGMAVYSNINWDVSIEIGKAILGAESYKINYETLLKLVRISWLHEGHFSSAVRLMLLKELSVENELKARATLLKVFDEVEVETDAFCYEEKLVNQYMSSFVLYSSADSLKTHYLNIYNKPEVIKANALIFIKLYEDGKFMDMAFKKYIEKSDEWETPITYKKKNVSIADYYKQAKNEKEQIIKNHKKNSLLKFAFWSIVFMGAMVGLFYLDLQKEVLGQSSINDKMKFIIKNELKNDSTKISFQPTDCSNELLKFTKNKTFNLEIHADSVSKTLIIKKDSVVSTKIKTPKDLTFVKISNNINKLGFIIQEEVDGKPSLRTSSDAFSLTLNLEKGKNYTLRIEGQDCLPPRQRLNYYVPENSRNDILDELFLYEEFDVKAVPTSLKIEKSIFYFDKRYESKAKECAELIFQRLAMKIPVKLVDSTKFGLSTMPLFAINPPTKIVSETWEKATLPLYVTEIWKGNVNSRFITFNLAQKIVYYSTGSKDTWRTYSIMEVKKKGIYHKIILKSKNGYSVIYLKTIRPTSFLMNICLANVKTLEETETDKALPCPQLQNNYYDTMTQYYEENEKNVYLPIQSGILKDSEQNKYESLKIVTSPEDLFYNKNNLLPENHNLSLKNNILPLLTPLNNPFDRPYISYYKLKRVYTTSAPNNTNSDSINKANEILKLKNLRKQEEERKRKLDSVANRRRSDSLAKIEQKVNQAAVEPQKSKVLFVGHNNNTLQSYQENIIEKIETQLLLEVERANTNEEALQKIRNNKYLLIISDKKRASDGENAGVELLQTIRKQENNIPFIFYAIGAGDYVFDKKEESVVSKYGNVQIVENNISGDKLISSISSVLNTQTTRYPAKK